MSDQKICPTCGTEYPLSERFCPRDGTALRSANVQADLLGSIVADRYHIIKKLGEGGMGTVYLAEHVKMGRKSALKVMNPGMNTDPDAIARFNREASNASRLSHPNICGIYDFGETPEGMIYLAMEFIEGTSLTGLIEKGGSLPAARCGSIIHQTADALQVAHDAGIVHRDLKPDNIMIARGRDNTDLVKVVDFGIAKASSSDAQKVTRTGLVVGTPEYMSPEQLAGDKLDGRSDIYSLGLVAFNCLTGTLPFPAETVQEAMIMRLTDRPRTLTETRADVTWTPALQRTLDKALERDAAERYQSAAEFGREFAAAIAAMPATRAIEAGTLVMGATGAGAGAAAAAGAAGGREVPLTRQSRASSATVPVDAVPAPRTGAPRADSPRGATGKRPAPADAPAPRRRAMPALLGGGGVLAAGLVAFMLMKPFGTAAGTTGDSTGVNTPVDNPSSATQGNGTASDTQSMVGDPPSAPTGGATQTDAGKAGGPTGQANDPQPRSTAPQSTKPQSGDTPETTPFTRPLTDDSGTGSADNSATVPTVDADSVEEARLPVDQVLRKMRERYDSANATEREAKRHLMSLQRLRRQRGQSLTPTQRANVLYVEMMAHGVLSDDAATCRAATQLLRVTKDPIDLKVAESARTNACP